MMRTTGAEKADTPKPNVPSSAVTTQAVLRQGGVQADRFPW